MLKIKESPIPKPKENEVLLKIQATAINRAETLQRKGQYPPPPGATDILGLEAVGHIVDENGNEKEQVMALLPGGGQAQYTVVHKDHVIPVPNNMKAIEAAAIPEVWLTAYLILKQIGRVSKGDQVMIQAAASGVGTAAIQLAKYWDAIPIASASSKEKLDFCQSLGAQLCVNQKEDKNPVEEVKKFTKDKGVDIILDCVGASHFDQSLNYLGMDGRWILQGLMSGAKVSEVNLQKFMGKRISFTSSTLRNRSNEFKAELVANFRKEVIPGFENGKLKPIIDKVFDVSWDADGEKQVQASHKHMEGNQNIGKIILNFKD